MRDTTLRDDLGVRGLDVFCPAAFATSLPWIASLDLFLSTGVTSIADHDQHLVSRLLDGVDSSAYEVVGPTSGPARSTLVVLSRRDGTAAARHRMLSAAGIDTAGREGIFGCRSTCSTPRTRSIVHWRRCAPDGGGLAFIRRLSRWLDQPERPG
jgi:hypothetical protein